MPIGGGSEVKLSAALDAAEDVTDFKIDPTGTTIAYIADQNVDETFELFRVPLAGGAAVQVNGAAAAGASPSLFQFTSDGSRLLYLMDQDSLGVVELYGAAVSGGAAVKLSGSMTPGGNVTGISVPRTVSDGTRVAYIADQDTDETFELYSTPLTGGVPTKLNPALVADGDLIAVGTDVVNSAVIYLADQETDGAVEGYSVPEDGGAATKLTGR